MGLLSAGESPIHPHLSVYENPSDFLSAPSCPFLAGSLCGFYQLGVGPRDRCPHCLLPDSRNFSPKEFYRRSKLEMYKHTSSFPSALIAKTLVLFTMVLLLEGCGKGLGSSNQVTLMAPAATHAPSTPLI